MTEKEKAEYQIMMLYSTMIRYEGGPGWEERAVEYRQHEQEAYAKLREEHPEWYK
jgi:hypothetical protein